MLLRSRALVVVGALVLGLLVVSACGRRSRHVVVYCSADAPVARPILEAFEKQTGIRVEPVFDTEATKITGLVNRLLAEHQSGTRACDVWWSSELLGTLRLARAGLLVPYTSSSAEQDLAAHGGWPAQLRGGRREWYAFAFRERVIAWNTRQVAPGDEPRAMQDLTSSRFKGRIGMARPQFGSTRGHMVQLFAHDPAAFETWLRGIAANGVRLYDGNAAVARALGSGEIWVGLTDNDDVANAEREQWPVRSAPAQWSAPAGPGSALSTEGLRSIIPNSTAIIDGAPNPDAAAALVDFLLSAECQRMLEQGDAAARAVHPAVNPSLWSDAPAPWAGLLTDEHLDRAEAAIKLCEEVLPVR